MRLLLDTHIAIWAVNRPERIPVKVRAAIEHPNAEILVSVVAVWEIAIKHQLRRPDAPPFSGHQAIGEFESAGFSLLNVSASHAAFVEHLPPLHADPFDRLMLAQAMIESLQFVTFDRHLSRYDAAIMTWS